METSIDILKRYWGFTSFRTNQSQIIDLILEGKDVLALMPTGGGKSLCFQVPTLMMEGLCLVITPLIALMKDQVENLSIKGISACSVHSGMSIEEVNRNLKLATEGVYKFLYISPERVETAAFQEFLEIAEICLIAIDEAHCISQWGYDFRPVYLRLAVLREYLPDVPILALTATATPVVQKDIIEKLDFRNYRTFEQPYLRHNLLYEVIETNDKLDSLLSLIKESEGGFETGIVYCKTRKLVEQVTAFLTANQIQADFYHGGVPAELRNIRQQNWKDGSVAYMVCTNAFGMGIDKGNVRRVIHFNIPDCLENYYQEAGRAGRDGEWAHVQLLYDQKDIYELGLLPDLRYPDKSAIQEIYQFLADFLQIPVGVGEGEYFDFKLERFLHNFQLPGVSTVYIIKALEQAGFISFLENIYLPSKVCFIVEKQDLYSFESSYPELTPIIEYLLRHYEGVFDFRVSVFEKYIARALRKSELDIKTSLELLAWHHIIEYLPQKETPQIHFLTNRAPAADLAFNYEAFLVRKKLFIERIQKMVDYTQTKICRNIFISDYFGQKVLTQCGQCDNCRSGN